ncbi:ATP-binding protein [Microseira wollei]|uniref:ATPase central domain-containing protein n=1 Tax=Microseira wollei NIES-4236 TaxID=2530354 RepID=A0AAV3XEF3_9CYAN|nr:ATP-binding protein [Microseira wollei]GET39210.1 ATPase central domain-containing protein [Microseira wollei NIES-4236]
MNNIAPPNWQEANQRYLTAALAKIRIYLQQYIARYQGNNTVEITHILHLEADPQHFRSQVEPGNEIREVITEIAAEELEAIASTMPHPPALDRLCVAFNLSPFERHVLLLCAGVELSASLAKLCAEAQGNSQFNYPTFSLALAVFPESHWSALAPVATLRHWRLIEVGNGESLTQNRLGIDERILHYLTGVSYIDDRLQGLIEPAIAGEWSDELPASHRAIAQQIVTIWSRTKRGSVLPAIQLCGEELVGKQAIAISACTALGMQLQVLHAGDIPNNVAEREALMRLWGREAVLSGSALLLDCQELEGVSMRVLLSFVERSPGLLLIAIREPLPTPTRPVIRLDINKPTFLEQQILWKSALGSLSEQLNGKIAILATQFNLSPPAISAVSIEVLNHINQETNQLPITNYQLPNLLWNSCRVQARSRLETLAQRIESTANWDNLVLPESQRQMLRDIAANVRQRSKVYETWGFARDTRGLGISALFVGASGTGKTMAAEVLANELQLDLYRIDLSSVVSKYIGETEKNLRRVFDAAETGGAILLFDEADALFGKRSEVKDSHDRYANIEVSYLLQRMEAYRGLAILTTNLKSALDTAFLRRIRFVVQFPFPDATQRKEIWRRIFPAKTPIEGLDFDKLARLNVPGGNIRNIALNAAFLAADAGESVRMSHLLRAAKCEYGKLEKSLTETEIGGWV